MTGPQNQDAAENGATDTLAEALVVALARIPLAPPVAAPDAPAALPPDVVTAVATFVGTLRTAGVPAERMLVAFKRVLKTASAAAAWHGPGVERAMISAAVETYFKGDAEWRGVRVGAPRAAHRPGKSALVVDDNEDSRFILGVMLQGEGIDTLVAANGSEALLIARRSDLGLILVDLAMPRMDGREVLLLLRQLSSIRATPIIAVTAFPALARAPDLLARGFAEVLMKPIGPADLRRIIQKHCPDLLSPSQSPEA